MTVSSAAAAYASGEGEKKSPGGSARRASAAIREASAAATAARRSRRTAALARAEPAGHGQRDTDQPRSRPEQRTRAEAVPWTELGRTDGVRGPARARVGAVQPGGIELPPRQAHEHGERDARDPEESVADRPSAHGRVVRAAQAGGGADREDDDRHRSRVGRRGRVVAGERRIGQPHDRDRERDQRGAERGEPHARNAGPVRPSCRTSSSDGAEHAGGDPDERAVAQPVPGAGVRRRIEVRDTRALRPAAAPGWAARRRGRAPTTAGTRARRAPRPRSPRPSRWSADRPRDAPYGARHMRYALISVDRGPAARALSRAGRPRGGGLPRAGAPAGRRRAGAGLVDPACGRVHYPSCSSQAIQPPVSTRSASAA